MTMRLGLAQGLVPTDPAELTPARAAEIAALGVSDIVTHFARPPAELAGARGRETAAIVEAAGLRIVQCAGTRPNLVSPEDDVRARSVELLHDLAREAAALGARMFLSGCGSLHPEHPYGPAPGNHTPEARARLVQSLREVALRAEEVGVPMAIESHLLTTLDTPEHVRAILDEVDSPWIIANFDPVNFIGSLADVYDSGEVIRRAGDVLGPRLAPAVHVKDVVVLPELVLHISEAPPGEGLLDFEALFSACEELPDGSSLIVEHLPAPQALPALRFVAAEAERHGIRLEPPAIPPRDTRLSTRSQRG